MLYFPLLKYKFLFWILICFSVILFLLSTRLTYHLIPYKLLFNLAINTNCITILTYLYIFKVLMGNLSIKIFFNSIDLILFQESWYFIDKFYMSCWKTYWNKERNLFKVYMIFLSYKFFISNLKECVCFFI